MLMRCPTEEDLKISLPQTPPAYMALMPGFPSFYPKLSLLSLYLFFSLLSLITDLTNTSTFPAFVSIFALACLFHCPSASSFRSLCTPFPLTPLLPFFQPCLPTRHLSQQSMPFHSSEGTNGIPAESTAAGSEQRLFCGTDSYCSAAEIPGPCHLLAHTYTQGWSYMKGHCDPYRGWSCM